MLSIAFGVSAQDDGSVKFPDRGSAWLKEGTFVNVENLRKVAPGLNKNQMYALLQEPHFSEGVFGVRKWNYIFNFRTGNGDEYVTCQYQVQFDDKKLVQATYWKEPECANLVSPKVPEVIVVPPPPLPPPVQEVEVREKVSLGADTLFKFGKSDLSSMSPEGRAEFESAIGKIKRHFKTIKSITVTGYTDRFGSAVLNQKLSEARATTVRNYLVSRGLPSGAMHAQGVGSDQPVVECPGKQSAAVIACLQPNRRVELEVVGYKNQSGSD